MDLALPLPTGSSRRNDCAHRTCGQGVISVAWPSSCLGLVAQQPELRDAGFRLPVETSSSALEVGPTSSGIQPTWASSGCPAPSVWTDSLWGVGPHYIFLSQGQLPLFKVFKVHVYF